MKISLSWLREHLRTEKSAAEIATILTNAGLEVGSIESTGVTIDKVVAAQILESVQHPNADRLSVCKVDDGSGTPRQIVCGAKNYKVGDKVPLALPGAVMPGDFKIKVGKLRGVESEGMMCSSKELGLGEGVDGLLILPPESKVGTPLSELFPAEEVFEIEITPNRPDWLGHRGVAREAAAFGAGELIDLPVELPLPKLDPSMATISSPSAASFYSIRRIDGVKVGPSPEWLRKRLESVGLRSINNVVDVTNFVMFETAQPLHAFDADRIRENLAVEFAAEGEEFTALDGTTYTLTPQDAVISDAAGIQALAGIMGGKASGVSETTKAILLESAVFDPSTVRRSSRTHGISSDSSYRFERGTDAETAVNASARAAALIVQVAGGEASGDQIIAGSIPSRQIVPLRGERVRSLLGIDVDDAAIASLLEKLGLKQTAAGFEIPSWRSGDLVREVDLIEEVTRLHGIENISAQIQGIPSHSSVADKAYDFALGLRRRLAGFGFHEARNGTLTGSKDQQIFSSAPVITVRNPMGEEHSTLRGSLIPGLLDSVARNLRLGAETIALFEIGKIYRGELPSEPTRLGLVMTGRPNPLDWRDEKDRWLDLHDLKGAVEHLDKKNISFRPTTHEKLPLALEILIAEKPAGILGILAPEPNRQVIIRGKRRDIIVAELDVALLQEASTSTTLQGGALPKFPSVRRDLALLLNTTTPASTAIDAVRYTLNTPLTAVNVFDFLIDPKGIQIPINKKSLGITLTFQRADRTLTTEEVTEALGRIVTRLRESAGAEIRG